MRTQLSSFIPVYESPLCFHPSRWNRNPALAAAAVKFVFWVWVLFFPYPVSLIGNWWAAYLSWVLVVLHLAGLDVEIQIVEISLFTFSKILPTRPSLL